MKKILLTASALITCAILTVNTAAAQNRPGMAAKPVAGPPATYKKMLASHVQWETAPNSLPDGAKMAILDGDPTKAGPFTIRLLLPPNYQVMSHTHPATEYLTVIEGEFFVGEGTTMDEKKMTGYPAGSFIVFPAKQAHIATTKNKTTVVQIQGTGPWDVNYADVANDPRKKKK